MSREKSSLTRTRVLAILGAIWLASNACDRLWLALDRSVPAWDQSNHLTQSLNYLHALQLPQFFSGEWWRNFWMLSPKYPPLTYIASAVFQQVLGTGNDRALSINFLYSALTLSAVYAIGKTLFSQRVGLWAAGLSVLFPRIYQTRLQYLIDTPLMALALASFCCLTLWRSQKTRRGQWGWALGFGVCLGLGLLTKQSLMFFLSVPLAWLGASYLWQHQWERLAQLLASGVLSAFIWFPWYRTNWIYLLSTAQNSNAIPATYEGDPALNTLAAWTYYWQDLPLAVSWVLLLVPLVGLLLHLLGRFPGDHEEVDSKRALRGIAWLGLYWFGAYFICSAIFNKDTRYIMPYLPVLGIFLAYCLTLWRGRWQFVRWGTVAVAVLVMAANLFPIPGTERVALALSPGVSFRPYRGPEIPNSALIETTIQAAPYQRSTLGVIANTDFFNHNTFNYFGSLAHFQVQGRELGSTPEAVAQDGHSFDWFVTKTGDNGFARDTQLALAQQLPADPAFQVLGSWPLTDGDTLTLYRRRTPTATVRPLSEDRGKVQLDRVTVPDRAPPGFPIPVTYQWSGDWESLQSGLVLLAWKARGGGDFWLHDHAIGMGRLYGENPDRPQPQGAFQAIETTAMLPDGRVAPGEYVLAATYLNRRTGETYPLAVPPVSLRIDPDAPPLPSPALDLVTQLRQLALELPEGRRGLDRIFQPVARLNQYDPDRDYLAQAEETLAYRLARSPGKHQVDWTWGLVLANVLQEDARGAIAALEKLVQIAPEHPYPHAYLAFVYLYNWQPKAAEEALQPALTLKADDPDIKTLQGIAALMQGKVVAAWNLLSP